MELIHERSIASSTKPHLVCGVSKATFHRWKNGSFPIPIKKAMSIAQRNGFDENDFLGKAVVTEALIADKKDELERQILLFEHYSRTQENGGKTDALFSVCRVIQAKLAASGHNVLLTCEQQQTITRTRLAISRPPTSPVLFITVFGEEHQIFCVLENDEGQPLLGFNATPRNLRKLIKQMHGIFNQQGPDFDLDTMAKNLITSLHA